MTLEQVEALAAQLTPEEQRQLVEHLQERLHAVASTALPNGMSEEQARKERIAKAEALIAELDALAESIGNKGEFDSAQDIRDSREERAARL